ncbi:glycosyltransferase [Microseira wollei]|uniref:Glycosyl transferase, group 1 n=1 Tax=Microseira wollei NIES-4236 TaxID=2530354 RepID=A0AAV3X497_9CYAN|nr:hypothetical protein [Microseira wollei]GET36001.1 glycosyl transferase, group 1 [Microseira wollei NIES-4236]
MPGVGEEDAAGTSLVGVSSVAGVSSVGGEVGGAVGDEVGGAVGDEVGGSVGGEVVGSVGDGIAEYVTEETGFKIEPLSREYLTQEVTNKIELLVNNEDLRKSMSAKAIERAREFEWECKARNLVKIYQEVIGETGNSASDL